MMGPQEKPKTLPANPKENVDEEDKEKINQAWAMHKTEDGKVFNVLHRSRFTLICPG